MVDPRVRFAIVWAARIAVAATFVIAATPKVVELEAFATAIDNYRAFPRWSINGLAAVVPMLELVGAAAVMSGRQRWVRAGAIVLGGLTTAFIALVVSVLTRGIDLQCGCFGGNELTELVGWPTLVRDVALLSAIVVAGLETRRSASGAPVG